MNKKIVHHGHQVCVYIWDEDVLVITVKEIWGKYIFQIKKNLSLLGINFENIWFFDDDKFEFESIEIEYDVSMHCDSIRKSSLSLFTKEALLKFYE